MTKDACAKRKEGRTARSDETSKAGAPSTAAVLGYCLSSSPSAAGPEYSAARSREKSGGGRANSELSDELLGMWPPPSTTRDSDI